MESYYIERGFIKAYRDEKRKVISRKKEAMNVWKEVTGEDKKGKPGKRDWKGNGDNLEVICYTFVITIIKQYNLWQKNIPILLKLESLEGLGLFSLMAFLMSGL